MLQVRGLRLARAEPLLGDGQPGTALGHSGRELPQLRLALVELGQAAAWLARAVAAPHGLPERVRDLRLGRGKLARAFFELLGEPWIRGSRSSTAAAAAARPPRATPPRRAALGLSHELARASARASGASQCAQLRLPRRELRDGSLACLELGELAPTSARAPRRPAPAEPARPPSPPPTRLARRSRSACD